MRRQCLCRQRQLVSASHPRRQCLRLRHLLRKFHPLQRCFMHQRQLEFIAPTPAVIHSATPEVEYFSLAPGLWWSIFYLRQQWFKRPRLSWSTSLPIGSESPAPVIERFSPAPAVFHATAPVVEYFSPVPAVFLSPAPVSEFFAFVPVEGLSAVTHGDRQASVPGQSSTAIRGAASSECLFFFALQSFTTAVVGRGSMRSWVATGALAGSTSRCSAELMLKKPPGREKSWLLVGQERFFLSFMELADAQEFYEEFQRASVP